MVVLHCIKLACLRCYIIFLLLLSALASDSTVLYNSPMYEMMSLYMKQHSLPTLLKDTPEQLCSRQFVVGKIDCNGMGNRNNQFLDNLMWAAVFNRTFIAHAFDSENCGDSVGPRRWICNNTMIIQLLEAAGCPMPEEVAKERFGRKNTFTSMQKNNYFIDGLRCCKNLEQMLEKNKFISPGLVPSTLRTRLTFEAINPLFGSSSWSSRTLKRFTILSGIDRYPHDKSRGFTTYGHLAIMSIRYSDAVKNMTKDILAQLYGLPPETFLNNPDDDSDDLYKFTDLHLRFPQNLTVFGYHGRHQKLDVQLENKMDVEYTRCLFHDARNSLLQSKYGAFMANNDHNNSAHPCSVLIASDRSHTFITVSEKAAEMGCTAAFVARSLDVSATTEHGPWGTVNGDASTDHARADTLLLSHSNYFMGLLLSTYSMFIANFVAARSEISHFYRVQAIPGFSDSDGSEFHSSKHLWTVENERCTHFVDAVPWTSSCQEPLVAGSAGYCRPM